jgi:prepilin-type N-terminal cleavage/methylation domain-containing protein/prepilin-type processing-associated H-X9-DG protein
MIIQKNHAFTLIELLVVIAIIAILAAIALPSFRTVQESGRAAKCANNLHQIGAAMFLYSDDNSNCFPISGGVIPWNGTDATTAHQSWMQQLAPYLGNPADPQTNPTGSVFTCPSAGQSIAAVKYYSYFNGVHAAKAYMQTSGDSGTSEYAAVKRTLIAHPTEQILSGDITNWSSSSSSDADKSDYTQNPISTVSKIHNGSINLLFADGHVEPERWNTNLTPAGYFDNTRMTTHYDGTGPSQGQYYGYLTP